MALVIASTPREKRAGVAIVCLVYHGPGKLLWQKNLKNMAIQKSGMRDSPPAADPPISIAMVAETPYPDGLVSSYELIAGCNLPALFRGSPAVGGAISWSPASRSLSGMRDSNSRPPGPSPAKISGRRDSNPGYMLPKHACYHYTTPRNFGGQEPGAPRPRG